MDAPSLLSSLLPALIAVATAVVPLVIYIRNRTDQMKDSLASQELAARGTFRDDLMETITELRGALDAMTGHWQKCIHDCAERDKRISHLEGQLVVLTKIIPVVATNGNLLNSQ